MKILKLTFSIIGIGLIIACGGNSSESESSSEEKTMTSREIMQQEAKNKDQNSESTDTSSESDDANSADYKTVKGDVVELTIEGNDQMEFNLDEMKVKAGSTVKLTLKHVGEMTKAQMGHNWVLLKPETNIMKFGQKSASAADNDYIPSEEENKVIAYTETIGGGEQTTITFEAPEKGTYDFICSFPGHYTIMQGKFIVE